MRQEFAHDVAQDALIWLANNADLLPVFLGATGVGLDDLRRAATDEHVMAGVLDFLLLDDSWIADFCAATERKPQDVATARANLPGGEQVNWT